MAKLYQIQQEIKKYFMGKTANPKILSPQAQKELSIYKSLALEKLNNTMKQSFPLCFKILKDYWGEIIIDFYHSFPSKSAIYLQISKNFSEYLKSLKFKMKFRKANFPKWLHELAEYEWAELDLFNFHPQDLTITERKKDLTQGDYVKLMKAHKIFKFDYPVSKIVEHLNSKRKIYNLAFFKKQKETLLIFRDKQNKVRYFLLSPGSYFLVDNLRYGIEMGDLYEKFMDKFNIKEKERLDTIQKIQSLLSNFRQQGILT
jgi:hypothetical protein